MLVGGVVEHQFGDDAQAAPVRFAQEHLEVRQRAVDRVDVEVVGDVVAVVLERRRDRTASSQSAVTPRSLR